MICKEETTILKQVDKKQEITKELVSICGRKNRYEVFGDWAMMMALAIRNGADIIHGKEWQEREAKYKEIAKNYSKEELETIAKAFADLETWIDDDVNNGVYRDWLGEIYMESGTSSKDNGQFFTPYSVNLMAVQTQVNDLKSEEIKESGKILTCSDPCIGAGSMTIAFCQALKDKGINFQKSAFIDGSDIDDRCLAMAYVQLSLIGAPARLRLQNSLTQEQSYYLDTPMLLWNYPHFEKVLQN